MNAWTKKAEIEAIESVGFLWPIAGWDIISVPDFEPSQPQPTYLDQHIPAPYCARMREGTSSDDLLFGEHNFPAADKNNSTLLPTEL